MYIREFKHMWYQIYKADYCLKHFKLVFIKLTFSLSLAVASTPRLKNTPACESLNIKQLEIMERYASLLHSSQTLDPLQISLSKF